LGLAIAAAITVAWHSFIWRLPWAAESLDFDMGPHLVFGGVNQLPAWALSFASGMTAAWLYMKLMKRGRPPGSDSQRALVAVVVVLAFIGLSIWTGLEAVSRYALLSPAYESPLMAAAFSLVLGAAMLAICLAPQWLQWPFANQRVRKLGDISYGIYLSHYVLMVIAINVLGFELVERFSNLLELSLFVIPLSVLYGYLSARFVEQPIRRWAHRFGARAQSGQTPRESA
jgi:peptidoglycan/LPS O-acetylase OafA/YrhL